MNGPCAVPLFLLRRSAGALNPAHALPDRTEVSREEVSLSVRVTIT